MSVVEVVAVEVTLDHLVEVINREGVLAVDATGLALRHAITAGDALLEARCRVPHGEWMQWCEDRIDLSYHCLTNYMRIANAKHLLRGSTTVIEAISAVKGSGLGRAQLEDAERDLTQRMIDEGMTTRQIGAALGISHTAVRKRLLTDEQKRSLRKDTIARNRELRRRRRDAELALRLREQDDAARRVGGGVSLAWADIQKLMVVVDSVSRNGETIAMREAFGSAYRDLLRAHQHISTVLRNV